MINLTKKTNLDDYLDFIITEDRQISLPRTPAEWIGKPEYIPISVIEMTSGGGMGGAHWYEFVRRLPDNTDFSRMLNVIDLMSDTQGIPKIINPRYIVQINSRISLCTMDFNSGNTYFPIGRNTLRCLVKDGVKLSLLDGYDNDKVLRKSV